MIAFPLSAAFIQGAISVQHTGTGLQPYRVPFEDMELYFPDGIGGRAREASGVRLSILSDTAAIRIRFEPMEGSGFFTCVCRESGFTATQSVLEGYTEVGFDGLPAGSKRIEIYVPQNRAIVWTGLELEEGSSAAPFEDRRPRWLAYGSSITQGCSLAVTPTPMETWPVQAAELLDHHVTNLGYGGNCHLDPVIARMMRDTHADLISMCLGINIYGGNSFSGRTFRPAAIGSIQLLRERHRDIPIVIISPIFCAAREQTDNAVGLSLAKMREELAAVVRLLRDRGDHQLHYIDGLALLGEADAHLLPDTLHPNGEGYGLMAKRFAALVRPYLNKNAL